MDIKVKVTEYKGMLIIETLKPEKDKDFITIKESGRIGNVLVNTGKHLGISAEALVFMKNLKISGDDIGEVDAWKTKNGKSCFGWLGPISRVIGPAAELSNTGFQDIDFVEIPNETIEAARKAIDKY